MDRNTAVLVRLSPKEKEHLKAQAAACALKMEPYIRKLIMGNIIRPRPPDELSLIHISLLSGLLLFSALHTFLYGDVPIHPHHI